MIRVVLIELCTSIPISLYIFYLDTILYINPLRHFSFKFASLRYISRFTLRSRSSYSPSRTGVIFTEHIMELTC